MKQDLVFHFCVSGNYMPHIQLHPRDNNAVYGEAIMDFCTLLFYGVCVIKMLWDKAESKFMILREVA